MNWTQQHSQNAVAARARKRLTVEPWTEPPGRAPVPRKRRAAITIQIRDHKAGDSLTLTLHRTPWRDHWHCDQGEYSTAQIAATVRHLVHSAALRDLQHGPPLATLCRQPRLPPHPAVETAPAPAATQEAIRVSHHFGTLAAHGQP